MSKLLLVDGSNLLFQMFFGMPSRIVNHKGKQIHGTLGFVGALLKMIRMVQPSHVAVLFDGEHENPRKKLDEGYKANRMEDERLKEACPYSQLYDIYHALTYMELCHAETTSCETDDWIAGYVKQYGNNCEIYIASMDSDYFQLINRRVHVLRYRGKSSVICNESYIRDRFGIEPNRYADFKALIGDQADHIPGVWGIGPKTASKLLTEFGSVDGILEHADEVKRESVRRSLMESADRLKLNLQLIQLNSVKEIPFTLEETEWIDTGISTMQVLGAIGLM